MYHLGWISSHEAEMEGCYFRGENFFRILCPNNIGRWEYVHVYMDIIPWKFKEGEEKFIGMRACPHVEEFLMYTCVRVNNTWKICKSIIPQGMYLNDVSMGYLYQYFYIFHDMRNAFFCSEEFFSLFYYQVMCILLGMGKFSTSSLSSRSLCLYTMYSVNSIIHDNEESFPICLVRGWRYKGGDV